ncbi:hypothetical protein GA0070613_1250 [Micromonospora inositola]|uniref:Uncharacterized protein n=1 Tax=Micromonospora inositola TaxID=47865 RepID=A0A1C5HF82_9ACTN|nr:hypothetical protein GA0070613_1250 [Micromonospora inositola]
MTGRDWHPTPRGPARSQSEQHTSTATEGIP